MKDNKLIDVLQQRKTIAIIFVLLDIPFSLLPFINLKLIGLTIFMGILSILGYIQWRAFEVILKLKGLIKW